MIYCGRYEDLVDTLDKFLASGATLPSRGSGGNTPNNNSTAVTSSSPARSRPMSASKYMSSRSSKKPAGNASLPTSARSSADGSPDSPRLQSQYTTAAAGDTEAVRTRENTATGSNVAAGGVFDGGQTRLSRRRRPASAAAGGVSATARSNLDSPAESTELLVPKEEKVRHLLEYYRKLQEEKKIAESIVSTGDNVDGSNGQNIEISTGTVTKDNVKTDKETIQELKYKVGHHIHMHTYVCIIRFYLY